MSSAGEIVFAISALMALGAAFMTVVSKSAIRAAIGLLFHIISLAGLYLTLNAHFLAAIQLIVYAGAVVVLFIFVIMLIGPTAETDLPSRALYPRVLGAGLMVMITAVLVNGVSEFSPARPAIAECAEGLGPECSQFGGVTAFGEVLYKQAALPFELVSILLLVAILGAIAVGRGRTKDELEAMRIRKYNKANPPKEIASTTDASSTELASSDASA